MYGKQASAEFTRAPPFQQIFSRIFEHGRGTDEPSQIADMFVFPHFFLPV
jgi:hypothetical protein